MKFSIINIWIKCLYSYKIFFLFCCNKKMYIFFVIRVFWVRILKCMWVIIEIIIDVMLFKFI